MARIAFFICQYMLHAGRYSAEAAHPHHADGLLDSQQSSVLAAKMMMRGCRLLVQKQIAACMTSVETRHVDDVRTYASVAMVP